MSLRTLPLLTALGSSACELGPSEATRPSGGQTPTQRSMDVVAKPTTGPQLERWESTYGEIRQPRSCFRQELRHCPDDPAVLDRLIAVAISERLAGAMPRDQDEWKLVEQAARRNYREWMASEEGLPKVEALVRARFDTPMTSRDTDDMAVIDLGLSPVKLRSYGRSSSIQVAEGLLLDRGELETAEVLRHLGEHRDEPAGVLVVVTVPELSSWTTFRYRWLKDQDRIAVTRDDRPNQVWLTGTLGGEPVVPSVHTSDLDFCYPGQQMLTQPPTVDCPL